MEQMRNLEGLGRCVLALLTVLFGAESARAAADVCEARWERLVNPPILALAADTVYYGVRLMPISDDIAWVLEGEIPDARYVSFTSYLPNANAFASLIDASVIREPDGSRYRLAVVAPEADSSRLPVPHQNRLERPSIDVPKVLQHGITIWYRVYVPYTEWEGVVPPRVYAYNLKTGDKAQCPDVIIPSSPVNALAVKKAAALPEKPVQEEVIDSFHVAADFDYQNRENGYLNASINYQNADNVAVFRFVAPRASTSYSARHPDASWSEADVRLYSVSLINGLGMNRVTRHDTEFPLTLDESSGLSSVVNLILGDATDPELISYAKRKGYVLLPRSTGLFSKDTLIYRQQAANEFPVGAEAFLGHVRKFVPLCTAENKEQPAACAGRCFIGPYAPRGRICTKSQLLADQCEVKLINRSGCF